MRAPLDMAKSTWPSPPVRMVALDWIFSPFCRGRGLSPSFSTMSGFPAKSATIVNPGFATELASVDWPINEMKVRNTKIKKTTWVFLGAGIFNEEQRNSDVCNFSKSE